MDAHNSELDNDKKASALENTDDANWHEIGKRGLCIWIKSIIYKCSLLALSHEEIVGNAVIFFLVGYETTATAMSWTFYNLSLHPDVQDKLYQEVCATLDKFDVRRHIEYILEYTFLI
jgi:hypothetical protein